MSVFIEDHTIEKALSSVPGQLLIGGVWRDALSGRTFDVLNPATGHTIRTITDASAADAVAALDAAAAATEEWAATPPRMRAEVLRRAFDLLEARGELFALVMTLEMGKPYKEALSEVAYAAEFLRWFSEEAVRISGRYGLNPEGSGHTVVSLHPVGPSYLITPWNFPLAMATRKLAPALAAGCTTVLKPAELTPLTTLLFASLLQEVGVPDGVVNVLTTSAPAAVSAVIIDDSRLRKLSFTGSTEVGRMLIAQSAHRVLRVSMELGGNAPFIVFADADIDKAVAGAVQAKFRNIGQACTAANRFIIHESVVDKFSEGLTRRVKRLRIGPGIADDSDIGPLINHAAVTKIDGLVRKSIDDGARLLCGGRPVAGPGSFYAPTVLADVPATSKILREELFGPVATVQSFRDEDDAVAMANDTDSGLVSYVYTADLARAHRLIGRIRTGMMGINVGVVSNAAAPFGGFKQSGIGREGGPEGIREYLDIKYTLIPVAD